MDYASISSNLLYVAFIAYLVATFFSEELFEISEQLKRKQSGQRLELRLPSSALLHRLATSLQDGLHQATLLLVIYLNLRRFLA